MPLADGGKIDKGKYVPPSQRGGGIMTMMDSRRSDENTLRIDNLPSHTEEKELRELIQSSIAAGPRVVGSRMAYAGRIQRLFVARNKQTGECKVGIFSRNCDNILRGSHLSHSKQRKTPSQHATPSTISSSSIRC